MNFSNIQEILDKNTGYKFDVPGVRLPKIIIPEDDLKSLNLEKETSNYDFLRALSRRGFLQLKLKKDSQEYKKYQERAKYELQTFEELGFTDYILLCWDIINWCKKNGVPTGLGRGSAAGSLIMYLIGVTGIDPIKHNLYFERFVSKTRAKKQVIDGVTYLDGSLAPDVDSDICLYRRKEVINYLKDKYNGNLSGILQFNTLSGKLLIKECGKSVGNKSENEMKEVAEHIDKVFGKVEDLEHAYNNERDSNFKNWCDRSPVNKKIYNISLKLRDLIKNKSCHPSGYLISYNPLVETIATETIKPKAEDGGGEEAERRLVCSADMAYASLVAIKVDLLGLKNVSIVKDVCDQIGINMKDIDINNEFIYQQFQDLKYPKGLFQIEAHTNYKVLKSVKPKNIKELSAVLAIARPGALQFTEQYSNYTNNGYVDSAGTGSDKLDKILAETGNCVLYQETLMRIANEVFGFSLDYAETLRKIIGKKKVEEMPKHEKIIKDKGAELGIPEAAEFYWKCLKDSANYSFNASHAFSYATLSAITTYLKFKHPKNFFLALLNASKNDPDTIGKISDIAEELPHFGIKLLPPDLNKSKRDFSIEGNDIRFGLLFIKGIQESTLEKFDNFKRENKNKFELFASLKEAKIGIGITSALIQAGAIEQFRNNRSFSVLEAQLWNILTGKNEHKYCLEYGKDFDFNLIKTVKFLNEKTDEKGKKLINDRRIATIRKKYSLYKEIYEKNRQNEKFANWFYEKKLMGYSSNITLKEIFSEKHDNLNTVSEVIEMESGIVKIVGQIIDQYIGKSRKGDKYLRLTVKDDAGSITCLAFKDTVDEIRAINGDKLPNTDNIVIVHGRKKGDAVFIDHLSVQDSKIYIKLAELKDDKKDESTEEVKNIIS